MPHVQLGLPASSVLYHKGPLMWAGEWRCDNGHRGYWKSQQKFRGMSPSNELCSALSFLTLCFCSGKNMSYYRISIVISLL